MSMFVAGILSLVLSRTVDVKGLMVGEVVGLISVSFRLISLGF